MTTDKMRHYINNDMIVESINMLDQDGLKERLKALDSDLRLRYPHGLATYPISLFAEMRLIKHRLGIK